MPLSTPVQVHTDNNLNQFACNCYSINETYHNVVSLCSGGKTAYVFKGKWLGYPYLNSLSNLSISCDLIGFFSSNSDVTCYNSDPKTVVAMKEDTGYADCVLDFCKDTDAEWTIAEGPCRKNRQGPLCGQCEEGYAVTPSSLECVQCRGDNEGVVIFLTLFLGFIVVVAAVLLNFRTSPMLASLLFFTQVAAIFMVNNTSFSIADLVNLDFTFGLCFSPHFTAIKRLGFHFFSPVYMLLLIASFTVVAGQVRCISRVVSRRSCLQGMWLVILLSYFSLANVVFAFMRCVELNPSHSISPSHRFLDDPSLACYDNPHLALFVISCLLAGLIILPFPLVILLLRRSIRFKPFADICYSNNRDSCWWWCAMELLRRLLFTFINTFVPSQENRTLKASLLTVSAILVLLTHAIVSPYRTKFDNVFASVVLFDLCCLSVISAGWGVEASSWLVAAIVYVPWMFALLVWLYQCRAKFVKLGRKFGFCVDVLVTQPSFSPVNEERPQIDDKDSLEMLVKRRGSTIILAGLRDSLLDDDLREGK